MNEMEKSMCEAIAMNTPFSADDIFSAWQSCNSFDLVLRAVELARATGLPSVRQAVDHLVWDYLIEQGGNGTRRPRSHDPGYDNRKKF